MEVLTRKLVDLEVRSDPERIVATLSTEEPVDRHFGKEVLVHSESSIDMARAVEGLPLLWAHHPEQIVGRVENVRLSNKRLRGELRPGNTTFAKEVWEDIRAKVVTDLSIGYTVDDTSAKREGDVIRFFRWMPYEVSALAIGADRNAKIGRGADLKLENHSMEDKPKVEVVEQPGERKRTSEILAIGKRWGHMDLALRAVEDGTPLEQFRHAILDKIGDSQPINTPLADFVPSTTRDMPSVIKIGNQSFPILTREQNLRSLYPRPQGAEGEFSVASFVRQQAGLEKRAIASGVATVPTYVASEIIDLVRASARIIQAGSGTIILTGPANAARLSGDPTVYQHTEAQADISESAPSIEAVALNPKALVCAIPIPFEVMNDSPNLQVLLDMSIAAAFAQKIDTLSIATLLADSDIPKSAAAHDPVAWAGVLAAVGVAMAANQDLPTAWVGNTADFIARASQLASTAGSWLGKPPVLEGMVELPTTSISAGTAFIGGFPQGFAIAVRQTLEMELVRFQKVTSAQHVLVCTMRADGVVLQPDRLFKCLKTP
jgi:HK97 family phage major capsid protein/HK97 family phage prohead protease